MFNRIYRLIWSQALQAWVAVSENTRGRGKQSGSLTAAARSVTAASLLLLSPYAHAAPTGGYIVSGSGSISASGATTTINQASDKLSLNWQSFNVGQAETVNFVQPSASALAVNRILDTQGSQILGKINANGQVWLINPNGVLFGKDAQINVGGLLASTLNPDDASIGSTRSNFSGSSTASVVNLGSINTTQGGYVALLGHSVSNQGSISAPGGTVAMGAGSAISLNFAGSTLLGLEVTSNQIDALAENGGLIQADGGQVFLTAGARESLLASVVNNTGVIRADTAFEHQGKIVLSGGGSGLVSVTGTLAAAGAGAGRTGGRVSVLGNKVGLSGNALIDVSGDAGGGIALIGGNYMGQGEEQNAQAVFVGANTRINADATTQGDGGKVIVWADETTRFLGTISARGGSAGGNGGFVETSGKEYLLALGTVDASAAHGDAGVWLLDPRDVIISDEATSGGTYSSNVFTPTADDATVNRDTIQNSLNGGTNVTINTGSSGSQDGNITIAAAIAKTSRGAASLTLSAAGSIFVNNIVSSTSNALNVNLNATAATTFSADGSLVTNGGNVSITGTGAKTLGNINTTGTNGNGNLTIGSSGAISQLGSKALTIKGTTNITAGETNNIMLTNDNDFQRAVTVNSGYDVSINDINSLNLGNFTVSRDLNITTNGLLAQAIGAGRTLTVTGRTTLAAGSTNDINLAPDPTSSNYNGAINNFIGAVSVTSGNIVNLRDHDTDLELGASTVSGTLTVNAGGAVTVAGNISTTNGAVSIDAGTYNQNDNIDINAGTGSISITADTVAIGTTNSGSNAFTTTGTLTLKPKTLDRAMSLGGPSDLDLSTNFYLSADEIAAISQGANSIVIGDSASTGALTIGGPVNLAGKTLTLNAKSITDNGLNIITAQTVHLKANGGQDGGQIGSNADDGIDIAATNLSVNTINNVDAFVRTGGIDMGVGDSNVGSATLDLTATGAVTQTGGTGKITAGTLKVKTRLDAGAAITLTNANDADNVNLQALNGDGTANVNADISYKDTDEFAISGINSGAGDTVGNVTLIAGGAVTQTETGAVKAAQLSADLSAGALTLNRSDNKIDKLNAITAPGGFTLNNGDNAVEINGAITTTNAEDAVSISTGIGAITFGASGSIESNGGNVTLTNSNETVLGNIETEWRNDQGIEDAGNFTIEGGSAIRQLEGTTLMIRGETSIAAGADKNVVLNNAVNNFRGAVSVSGKDVFLHDSQGLVLGASTVSGTLTVIAGGAIEQTGALVVAGATTLEAGENSNITLHQYSNIFTGAVSVTSGKDVSIKDTDTDGLQLGASTVKGTLNITAGGAITQTTGTKLEVAGATTLTAQNPETGVVFDITLDQSGNDFNGAVSVAQGNNVTLHDTNALRLGASTVSGTLTVNAGGAIDQGGVLTVTGATTLAAGTGYGISLNYLNNDFKGAVSVTATSDANTSDAYVSLQDANALELGESKVSGELYILARGKVWQSGTNKITAGTLTVHSLFSGVDVDVDAITLTNAGNEVAKVNLQALNGGPNGYNRKGVIQYTDSTGFDISGINNRFEDQSKTAGKVILRAGGAVTQSGRVEAAELSAILSEGALTLNLDVVKNGAPENNIIAQLNEITAPGGFTLNNRYKDVAINVAINGAITSTNNVVSITTTGAVTQADTGKITAGTLNVKTLAAGGAAIKLNSSDNEVGVVNLQARNREDDAYAAGAIQYADANGFDVASIATTSDVTLKAGGAVTQSGGITATGLALTGTGGAYTLHHEDNAVTTLAADTGSVSYKQKTELAVGTVNDVSGVSRVRGVRTTGTTQIETQNANADLTLDEAVTSDAFGDAIILKAGSDNAAGVSTGGQLINRVGADGIKAFNGRYLVYSGDPDRTTEGVERYAKRYNADATYVPSDTDSTESTFFYRAPAPAPAPAPASASAQSASNVPPAPVINAPTLENDTSYVKAASPAQNTQPFSWSFYFNTLFEEDDRTIGNLVNLGPQGSELNSVEKLPE